MTGDTLVFATDGVRREVAQAASGRSASRWNGGAAELLREFATGNDDALLLTARYGLPACIVRESAASARLQERYFDSLEAYVGDAEESALLDAYELGRQIMDSAGGVLDLSSVHQDAMEAVMRRTRAGRPRELAARRCHEFLDEALSPFEMAQRGFREANMRLMTVLKQSAHQSAQLSAVIASIMTAGGG